MAEDIATAIDYFGSHEEYFWRWAEHGRVIEFANKKTICYREDLAYLLGELPEGTRFAFGSMLLLLCACKDNWDTVFEIEQQMMRVSLAPGFSSAQYLQAEKIKGDAYAFLKIVNSLPADERSGIKRISMIKAVIGALPANEQLPDILRMVRLLNTGELDYPIRTGKKKLNYKIVCADLSPLAEALRIFPDKETLVLKLRTGLLALPEKAPVILPENEGPDLISQLESDQHTRMLGVLTRKILAAIRIPMHLSGSSDFALGGVADISNRGDFDQLLLSELAQDDLLLTARLANNEALFLKRETPPNDPVEELGIFIDVTLKMWGIPRVLSLATGLAIREGKLKNQQLKVWAIGAGNTQLDLDSKKGIVAALEQLDPALDCGEQLVKTIQNQTNKKGKYILITSEGFLQDAATLAYFHRIREHLNFIATVNRNGHVQLIRVTKGRQQLINEARIRLEDLVNQAPKTKMRLFPVTGVPAIMLEDDFPLYYPSSKVKLNQNNTFVNSLKQPIVITQDKRVLCWPEKDRGAVELVDYLSEGSCCFAESYRNVYLLVISHKLETIKLYRFHPDEGQADLYKIESRQHTGYTVKYIKGQFFLMGAKGLDVLDLDTLQVSPGSEEEILLFKTHQNVIQHFLVFNSIKKQINNGYSVINSAKSVYVHTAGRLFLDKRQFMVVEDKFLWQENTIAAVQWIKPIKEQQVTMAHLPNIKFTKFTWKNGSEILLDSRGLLHLKSYDETVPEMSILLVVDQPAACWCAEGVVSGSAYFTGKTNAHAIAPSVFYKNYIQRFIITLN